MKNKILEIIQQKPKHYTKIVKSNKDLLEWVKENNLADSDHLPTQIYSAVHQQSNICPLGKKKTLHRWATGFSNCGPAAVCECTRNQLSASVKLSKSNVSKKEKDSVNQKRKNTMIEKYGVAYNSQRSDLKHIWKKPKVSNDVLMQLNDRSWMYEQYIVQDRSAVDIADELDVYYSTVIEYCKKHNFKIKQRSQYSLVEKQIANFVIDLGFECIKNQRQILNGKEIDIFVPSANLAIEVNGLYWHSFDKKHNDKENKNRHLEKTLVAHDNGIDLIHITDWEWKNKNQIIKSLIRTKLLLNNRIYARRTISKIVDSAVAQQFLNENHIQGQCYSTQYVGLYHQDQLVMLLSAGRSRFGSGDIEIHRIAAKKNTSVIGGAGKLLKYLLSISDYERVIAYCDRDKSNGNVYQQLGFDLIKHTGPGYFWTDGNEIISRYRCQKSKLKNWLPLFDPLLSESENMFAAGYRRYWTCGNLVFEYHNK